MTLEQQQLELNFTPGRGEEGLNHWHEERRRALEALAQKMGLPLGREVEVCLRDGIVLRGKLALREEQLFIEPTRDFRLELMVDKVPFTAAEIESCVRVD